MKAISEISHKISNILFKKDKANSYPTMKNTFVTKKSDFTRALFLGFTVYVTVFSPFSQTIFYTAAPQAYAQQEGGGGSSRTKLTWSSAGKQNSELQSFVDNVILALMGVFCSTAVILVGLAFKQLSADGQWREFWSKCAGGVGMFVAPFLIQWIRNLNS